MVDSKYPFWLTTGRAHIHYHTGTMTRRSKTLHEQMPDGFVEINPFDAEAMGLIEGDPIKIETRRGQVTAPAMITERVAKGTVFMTFHFFEACANVLTNPAHDPSVKIPEYKVCAARIERAA
jgi:anaerobic selenocysteine-containing dehydrogenase